MLKMTDHHLVTLALDTVDALMSPPKQPKVLLFDIGGVCVSCDLSSLRVSYYVKAIALHPDLFER